MAQRGRPKGSKNKPKTNTSRQTQSSKPGEPVKKKEPSEYICIRCEEWYDKQVGNFSRVRSPLYTGNNGYLPWCAHCVDELFAHYTTVLGSEENAIKRICEKFDIYYSEALVNISRTVNVQNSRMKNYISKGNGTQYKDSYDDYLDELNMNAINSIEELETSTANEALRVSEETVRFFGVGFTPEEYVFLQHEFDDWTTRHECQTKAQEELFKALCFSQLEQRRAQQGGDSKKIADAAKTFQDLLGSAKLKPSQKNEDAFVNQNSFGVLIQKWENEEPIPEVDEDLKDVDGIIHLISTYFLGHLCSLIGKKDNSLARMYKKEMDKYRVERPEYEGDDEALFDSIFGNVDDETYIDTNDGGDGHASD